MHFTVCSRGPCWEHLLLLDSDHSIQLRDVQVTPDPDQQQALSPVPDPQILMENTELNEVVSNEGLQHQNPAFSQNHIKCKI